MHTIQCPTCRGSKRVPLPGQLADTLAMVVTLGSPTAPEIFSQFGGEKMIGVGVTAINNRLEDLRLLGFVRRDRWGKSYKWTATAKARATKKAGT